MPKYRVIVQTECYMDEIIEAEDETDLQEQIKELESWVAEHASEDVRTSSECLDCEEEE